MFLARAFLKHDPPARNLCPTSGQCSNPHPVSMICHPGPSGRGWHEHPYMPEAERPAQPPYRVVNIPPPSPSSAPNSTPAPSASCTSTPPARAAPPTPAAYQIQHPTVFATPTNFPRKRTRQGFCWGCGASLKEAHSSTCEFDVKRLKPADVPTAHVTTVVRAVGGFAILSLFVFTPPPAQGER